MKIPKVLIGLGLVVVAVFLIRGVRVEQYRDANVKAGEVKHPWDMFAIHASRPLWLTVGGETYRGVRGLLPYYLNVPGTNAVLFVTEDAGKVVFHVVNTKSGSAVEIDGKGSTFGWSIGAKRATGEQFTDWIESATDSQLRLATRTDWGKAVTLIDLSRRAVAQVENLYLDADGQVTNRIVYPKGN